LQLHVSDCRQGESSRQFVVLRLGAVRHRKERTGVSHLVSKQSANVATSIGNKS